ncbi:MAG: hypothetical protein ACI9VR_004529 [Cognaticolwellia sp.]|jgi:hypothetical protein
MTMFKSMLILLLHEAVTAPGSLLTPGYAASPAGVWLAGVRNRAEFVHGGLVRRYTLDQAD